MQPTPPPGEAAALAVVPVSRRSLGDAVFAQLREQIVQGALRPGATLPAERVLCERFGVNRGAVREALKRLEQIRLISMQQGGRTRVCDFRRSSGLELLPALAARPGGGVDAAVLRGIVEMRSALGADAARLAAERGGRACGAVLRPVVARMRAALGDGALLEGLTLEFWDGVVEGSGNVAYRLAFNSLRETTESFREVLRPLLAEEVGDVAGHARLARAIAAARPAAAERAARALAGLGERRIVAALDLLLAADARPAPAEAR